MAVTLRYFTEFGKPALQKNDLWRNLCKSLGLLHFLVSVQCRHKERSRSLSHLLMSFLLYLLYVVEEESWIRIRVTGSN